MRLALPTLGLFTALTLQAQAIQFVATNSYDVAKGETVADEQWVYAVDAEVNGLVKDDLFVLSGNRMELGGEFERNVWGLGGSVMLEGDANRNVRLMGKTVQIGGSVGGNAMVLGDTVKITPDAAIGGGLKLIGNSVILEGTTQGDVSITASRIATISGTVEGNLDIVAPEIILQRDARIGGNLTYTANKELVPAEGIVAGRLNRTIPQSNPAFSKTRIYSHAMWFFAALLVAVPFITLFPMTAAMATQSMHTAPWKCLWVGALCAMALPIFGIMAVSSLVGVPLGMLILGTWGFLTYTSRIVVGLVVGTLILRKNSTSIGGVMLAMTTGLAIIYIATAIPAISWSVQIVVVSMGTGALLLGMFQSRRVMVRASGKLNPLEEQKNQQNNPEEKTP